MSPENIHKLMGFYMEVLKLGVVLQYMVSAALTYSVYRGVLYVQKMKITITTQR